MLFPTTIVGSYPQPDWLIDRAKLAGPLSAARAGEGAVARGAACLDAGPGRRDAARDPRPGGGGAGHRQATARSAARATPTASPPRSTASTSTTRARRWIAPGIPIRCRASSARSTAAAGARSTTCSSCAAHTDRKTKMTVPGPFTMTQQAQNDYYRRGRGRDGLRGGGQRGDPRPVRGRRGRRPDRRALHAGAARNGARLRAGGPEPRARRRHRHDRRAHLLRLRRVIHERPSGYSFLPELAPAAAASRSRSRPRSRTSTARCWSSSSASRSFSACIDLSDMTVETPETVAARIRRALPYVARSA